MKRARLLGAVAALVLGAYSTAGLLPGPAQAASTVTNGSDWGAQGDLGSDSAVTVRWDNVGNPEASIVPRNGRQVLPHTGGKTYLDVDSAVSDAYFDTFGSDNGLGGLAVTVSQTQNLVNQTVSIDFTGAKGGATLAGANSTTYFQVMQCWGGLTDTGQPDPAAANPDPATCQYGARGSDTRGGGEKGETRYLNQDPLAFGGDWAAYYPASADDVPFTAISGATSGSTAGGHNEFFNNTTTNEASSVGVSADGAGTRNFEVQTSLESSGLGCGYRSDAPSTASCWLVIVPRVESVMRGNSALAPSLWAQRLQVKLGFNPIAGGCPGGRSRSIITGSELFASAAASWVPGLCDSQSISFGYTQIGDENARSQFARGANPAVLTSEPLPADTSAAHVPVTVAAPVFAYNLTYQPQCLPQDAPTEADAQRCGYDDRAHLVEDAKRVGTQVTELNLDARLVVKLLTQSYRNGIISLGGNGLSGWEIAQTRPSNLFADPEFKRLNPGLVHFSATRTAQYSIWHAIVESTRTDAAAEVWRWIIADPDASAFLNGCPDPDGMTINPFYSTRSYVGCEAQQATLAAQADADRAATDTASAYVDVAPIYPPDGSAFPLPTWQEGSLASTSAYSVVDHVPTVDSMPIAGRDVAIGYSPQNSEWCATQVDAACQPSPGKWKDPKTRQPSALLALMAVTDSATAARFHLPTAKLCDDAGTHCVGADTSSLTKAANEFVSTDVAGVVGPGPADYAGGAYPLTLPVYAAVSMDQPDADRAAYADALDYITTKGQTPGFEAGQLPPGYAPLTDTLKATATAQIAALRAPSATETPTPQASTKTPKPTKHSSTPSAPQTTSSPVVPPASAPPAPTPPATTAPTVESAPEMVPVAAGTESWPSHTIPLLLTGALLAGLSGPLMLLRGRLRLRR